MTARARQLFKEHFGNDAEVFIAFNGTGANVVGLQSLLRPFEAVICAETAHINVDECGAPERFLGSKLISVATPDGKLTPELVEAAAGGVGDEHHVQPKVVSITQSTEVGTCYRVEEVENARRLGSPPRDVAPPGRGSAVECGRLPRCRSRGVRVGRGSRCPLLRRHQERRHGRARPSSRSAGEPVGAPLYPQAVDAAGIQDAVHLGPVHRLALR